MPRSQNPQEDETRIIAFADDMGLEGDDRENFISESMERLGWVAKKLTEWIAPEPPPGEKPERRSFYSKPGEKVREISSNRSSGGHYAAS